LCLAGEEEVAGRVLEGPLSYARRQQRATIVDPKTTLQEAMAPATVEYAYERQGPEHDAIFHATVTDRRGRRGDGSGTSKRRAAQSAALDFLKTHVPQALSVPTSSDRTQRRAPIALPGPESHVRIVQRLRSLFDVPDSAPLLSQALIHTSWAYEHRSEMIR